MVGEFTLGPGPDHDLLGLVEPRLGFVMVDAKALVIIDVVGRAAAEPDDQSPLGEVVDDRDLLGEADRMVQRHLQYREAEFGAAGRGGKRAGKADRVGIGADAVEMVLGEPDHVNAEFVREPSLAQGLVDDGAVMPGIAAVGKQEIAEFHYRPRPEPDPP